MAEIVLFHHVCGRTAGVSWLASVLAEQGHAVHTPDLFDGRTFSDVDAGTAFVESIGEDAVADRAARAVRDLPAATVFGGLSMGAARAAEAVLARPGARGAFFLYGAVAPSWWDATWPAGVPSQAHVREHDPWREPDAEAEYLATVPGGEVFVYPGTGHLFAEPGHPDHDDAATRLATDRVLAFLAGL